MNRGNVVGCVMLVLGLAGVASRAIATDPPVSLVSFAWSANGAASPSAGANCDAGCDNTSGCNTSTVASYADGGIVMAQSFASHQGDRTCYGVCGGAAIASAYGQVNGSVSIYNPYFDGAALHWQWSNTMITQAGAGGGAAICGHSFGTGQASTGQTWDTVFDVLVGDAGGSAPGARVTLLSFGHAHMVSGSSPGAGGNAASSWTLERVGGPTIEGDSIQNTAPNVDHTGSSYIGLAAGRYHFHASQSTLSTFIAPGQTGIGSDSSAGSTWVWRFEEYVCASIGAGPQNTATCNANTAFVYFGVTPTGTSPSIQWQWRPTPIAAWRNVVGQENYNDSAVRAFDASNVNGVALGVQHSNAHAGATPAFRCIVSNSCASVTSNAAILTICAADFNCSGAPTINDIFDFLAAWFASDPSADFNGVGGIGVNDIFDFLAAWFAGC